MLNSNFKAQRYMNNSAASLSLPLTQSVQFISVAWLGTAQNDYLFANRLGIGVLKSGFYAIHIRLAVTTNVDGTKALRTYVGYRLGDTDRTDARYLCGGAQSTEYNTMIYINSGDIIRPIAHSNDTATGTVTVASTASMQVAFLSE